MKKELTFEEAKALALKLTNDAFVKKKFFIVPGRPVPIVHLDNFHSGAKKGNRWEFEQQPPAGSWASVSFNIDGTNPKVKVGFSPE